MAFAEWEELCAHAVTVEPFLLKDGYGASTYGSAATIRCRIQGQMKSVTTRDGSQRASSVQIYCGPSPLVGPDDRVTLPADFVPRQPPILSVQRESDEEGLHHQVIYC